MKIQQLFDGLEYYRLKRYSDKINANTKRFKRKDKKTSSEASLTKSYNNTTNNKRECVND